MFHIWPSAWQNQHICMCAQRRFRSVWASAQSNQVIAGRMKKNWVLRYLLSAQRRLWSDWRMPRLICLRWVRMSFCWFCHALAHILIFENVQICLVQKRLFSTCIKLHFEVQGRGRLHRSSWYKAKNQSCADEKEMSQRTTKPTKWHVRPTKTQISLSIRPACLISLRCALNGLLSTKAFFMRTATILIRAGRTCHFVGFVVRWFKFYWRRRRLIASYMQTVSDAELIRDIFRLVINAFLSRFGCLSIWLLALVNA